MDKSIQAPIEPEAVKVNDIEPQVEESNASELSCTICVCRNIRSNKYFIVVDTAQDDKFKLVTPKNEILMLQSNLFSEPEDMDELLLRKAGLLSEEQLDCYYRYIEEQEKELSESVSNIAFKHSGAEPEYVKTYRSMLNNADSMPSKMHRIVAERKSIKWYGLVEQLTKHGYAGRGGSLTASLKVLEIDGYLQVEGTGDGKLISYARAIERTGTDKASIRTMKELDKILKTMTEEQKKLFLEKIKELL